MATTEEVAITAEVVLEHLSLTGDSKTNLIMLVGTKRLSKLLKD